MKWHAFLNSESDVNNWTKCRLLSWHKRAVKYNKWDLYFTRSWSKVRIIKLEPKYEHVIGRLCLVKANNDRPDHRVVSCQTYHVVFPARSPLAISLQIRFIGDSFACQGFILVRENARNIGCSYNITVIARIYRTNAIFRLVTARTRSRSRHYLSWFVYSQWRHMRIDTILTVSRTIFHTRNYKAINVDLLIN